MKFFAKLLLAVCIFAAIVACDKTSTIGASLVDDQVEIVIDSTFTVTGKSQAIESVLPRTVDQLIGDVTIPGYGRLRSSVVAQFLPSTVLDTATYSWENVDSAYINFIYAAGDIIGDSLAPMGVTVYPLTRQLPSSIASNFDPTGYYDPSQSLASQVYITGSPSNDSIAALSSRSLSLKLPTDFARNLFKSFEDNPSNYVDGQVFAENVFPGVFVETTYGSGRITCIQQTTMTMCLSKTETLVDDDGEESDTTYAAIHQYYMVTPEVLNNNNITLELDQSIQERIDEGQALMVAPAGYQVDFRFPAPEVISAFKSANTDLSLINYVTLELPVDSIENDYQIAPPPYALLILTKDVEDFFKNHSLPDNITSFYAEYDSDEQYYYFSGLRTYINQLIEQDEITEEDYMFSLIPVQVEFETNTSYYYGTTYTETDVIPFIYAPSMARIDLENAKVKLIYAKQYSSN